MVDVSIGGIPESTTVADDNVVAFPTLMSGGLADLMASASAPGTPHELRHEMTARADFRSQATSRMQPRRLRWRKPLGIAVATGACLITTTTGLAAATGFPQSAARIVDPILNHVDINVTPQTVAPPQVVPGGNKAVTQGSSSKGTADVSRSRSRNTPACSDKSDPSGGDAPNLNATGGSRSCLHQASTAAGGGTSARTPANQDRNLATGFRSGSGQGGAGGADQSTGTGQGTGSNRGGNQGTGSNRGGDQGTGSNRGGNQGTGSNRGRNQGTGSNRGGNKGTGSGRGGKHGTGKGHGSGTGGNGGSGSGHHHHGTTPDG